MRYASRMTFHYCAECDTDRPVREIMGGNYYVLGYCGHVTAIPTPTPASVDK